MCEDGGKQRLAREMNATQGAVVQNWHSPLEANSVPLKESWLRINFKERATKGGEGEMKRPDPFSRP